MKGCWVLAPSTWDCLLPSESPFKVNLYSPSALYNEPLSPSARGQCNYRNEPFRVCRSEASEPVESLMSERLLWVSESPPAAAAALHCLSRTCPAPRPPAAGTACGRRWRSSRWRGRTAPPSPSWALRRERAQVTSSSGASIRVRAGKSSSRQAKWHQPPLWHWEITTLFS